MIRMLTAVAMLAVAMGCGGGESSAPADPHADFAAEARAATNRLRVELKSALGAAMQDGGPVAAIEVCHERAPEIAADLSAQTGLAVGRVAVRHRNPANAADPAESAVLAAFEARPALDDTVVVHDGRPTYLRAIRIDAPACLTCHGPEESLDPGLRDRIATLYPDDRATGFVAGNLRGAFVVR